MHAADPDSPASSSASPIGEGGFGAVFLAEQERPVARKVALEIIKLGMDTRGCIRAIADHFAARDLAQPGEGHDLQGAMWREMLNAAK